MKKHAILASIFSALLLASVGAEISADITPQKTLVVGSRAYQTINSAIKDADYGDRIIVQSGRYVENLILKTGLLFDFQKDTILEGNITDGGFKIDSVIDGELFITNRVSRKAAVFLGNPSSRLYLKAVIYSEGMGAWAMLGELELFQCDIVAGDYGILSSGKTTIRESKIVSFNNSAVHVSGGHWQVLNSQFISSEYYAGEQSGGSPLFVDCTFYALSKDPLRGAGFNAYSGEELIFSGCTISAGPNSLSIDNENSPRPKNVKTILPTYINAPINSNITTTGEFIIYNDNRGTD